LAGQSLRAGFDGEGGFEQIALERRVSSQPTPPSVINRWLFDNVATRRSTADSAFDMDLLNSDSGCCGLNPVVNAGFTEFDYTW